MGTMLLAHGIPAHSCLEALNLSRPSLILEIHKSYLAAGARALVTNSFGANRPRLESFREGRRLEAINRAAVRIAEKAAHPLAVYASIGPLGREAKRMSFSEMVKHFREQARALEKEKPTGYLVETMPFLAQAEAATIAVREVSSRTCITLMTFPGGLDAVKAAAIEAIAETLRTAGADVIGVNCGRGPEESYLILKALALVDEGPFCIRPSAGLPGNLLSPDDFGAWALKFKKLGCRWLGGCCGTTPAHIRSLGENLRNH